MDGQKLVVPAPNHYQNNKLLKIQPIMKETPTLVVLLFLEVTPTRYAVPTRQEPDIHPLTPRREVLSPPCH